MTLLKSILGIVFVGCCVVTVVVFGSAAAVVLAGGVSVMMACGVLLLVGWIVWAILQSLWNTITRRRE